MTPHKHAEVIKAWADGKPVQVFDKSVQAWQDMTLYYPHWDSEQYRVKPKEPVVMEVRVVRGLNLPVITGSVGPNVAFYFDPDKHHLIKVELIND